MLATQVETVSVYYNPQPGAKPEDKGAIKLDWTVSEVGSGKFEIVAPGEHKALGTVTVVGKTYNLVSEYCQVNNSAPSLKACVLCLARRYYGRAKI